MFESTVLQAVAGFSYDFTTFPGTVILIVTSAIILGIAFLGLYYAYTTIGRAVEQKAQADSDALRRAANAETQAVIKQAKADLIADFISVLQIDKTMKEQLTLASVEERALSQAAKAG